MAAVTFQGDTLATPPVGTKVAVVTIAGEEYQLMKVTLGAIGTDPVSETNPLPVIEVATDMEGGGKVAVGIVAVEMTFTGATKSIILTADLANTGTLYVGKSTVTTAGVDAFAFLEAGESITIEFDDATNAVFVAASVAAQNVWKGALI